MRFWITLSVFCIFMLSKSCEKQHNNNTFVATKEWQEIREDQSVPAGLHVRINLTTGKKEAKLLEENEEGGGLNKTGSLIHVKQTEKKPEDEAPSTTAKEDLYNKPKISKTLSDALRDMNQNERIGLEYTPEKLTLIKHKYKSYKELKESYDEMRSSFKTDGEILSKLLEDFRNASKIDAENTLQKAHRVQQQSKILDDLDYLVHQIDNSLLFIAQGGLDALLPIVVNETYVELRIKAMRVLGSVTQNNPQAQILSFEKNFGTYLAKVLITSKNTEELSAALYAFGSLLRKFPYAEKRILSTSGMQALVNVISKDYELKLKAKAVILVSDIILEQKQVLSTLPAEQNPEATSQYTQLKITDWLESNNYCQTMEQAIVDNKNMRQLLDLPDILEYFLEALENTRPFCSMWSQSTELKKTLIALKTHYNSSSGDVSVYHHEIAERITKVMEVIFTYSDSTFHSVHNEL